MTTVFRIEKNTEFVVMSNKFLRNKEMSLKAKGLLALCLALPETWDYSLNGLVAICKENHTAIRSSLKELEQFGHLKRNRVKDAKGKFMYEYIIFEVPYIENLHADKLHMEKLHAENPRQINKEKESIKEESIKELNLYIEEHANATIQSLLKEYLEMRKEIEAPISMRGLKMLLTRVDKLSSGKLNVQRLMLENAIMNQWKNVYKPKEQEIAAANEVQINELKSFYNL